MTPASTAPVAVAQADRLRRIINVLFVVSLGSLLLIASRDYPPRGSVRAGLLSGIFSTIGLFYAGWAWCAVLGFATRLFKRRGNLLLRSLRLTVGAGVLQLLLWGAFAWAS